VAQGVGHEFKLHYCKKKKVIRLLKILGKRKAIVNRYIKRKDPQYYCTITCIFSNAGDRTQSLAHARGALYH
jgi:hypothetical protein